MACRGNRKVSDTSEDEDIASAMVKDRRFGLQPYIYDPSASSSSEGDGDGPDTPPPARRVGSANWCSCNGCRAMLTDYESLCCREVDRAGELCQDQGVSCITKHPWFELYCLNRPVLDLAHVKMQYFCPLDAGNRTQEEQKYGRQSRKRTAVEDCTGADVLEQERPQERLDTRLREAEVEAVYCLARGSPKGPNIPRAQLNHQGPPFPGHRLSHAQPDVAHGSGFAVAPLTKHLPRQVPPACGYGGPRGWGPWWRYSPST
ncbi:P2X purinoceptor 7-like isoform X1 [Ixodes scapularis]